MPALSEVRRLAHLVLGWTFRVYYDTVELKRPDLGNDSADGSVFGEYATRGNEMEAYGYGNPLVREIAINDCLERSC